VTARPSSPPPTAAVSTVVEIPAEAELDRARCGCACTVSPPSVVHGHLVVRARPVRPGHRRLEHAGTSNYGELVRMVTGDGAQ
jgi:hypothetical protein